MKLCERKNFTPRSKYAVARQYCEIAAEAGAGDIQRDAQRRAGHDRELARAEVEAE